MLLRTFLKSLLERKLTFWLLVKSKLEKKFVNDQFGLEEAQGGDLDWDEIGEEVSEAMEEEIEVFECEQVIGRVTISRIQ